MTIPPHEIFFFSKWKRREKEKEYEKENLMDKENGVRRRILKIGSGHCFKLFY